MRGTGATGCRHVTPCSENNGGCDPRAPCIPGLVASICGPCQAGFQAVGGGKAGDLACVDIDACAAGGNASSFSSASGSGSGLGQCDAEATGCVDTPGDLDPTGKQHTCEPCRPGFAGVRAAAPALLFFFSLSPCL